LARSLGFNQGPHHFNFGVEAESDSLRQMTQGKSWWLRLQGLVITQFTKRFAPLLPHCKNGRHPKVAQVFDLYGEFWWVMQGLNLRPLPCEGSALPLS
jgi:hypothetical protein